MSHTIKAAMAKDFAAFKARLLSAPELYEVREEVSLQSVADALDKIAGAFDQYKQVNDARIEALKAGKSTSDMDAKLAKMDETIAALDDVKTRLEKAETKLARPGALAGGSDQRQSPEAEAYKSAFLGWVRNPADAERRAALQQRAKELQRVEAKAFGGDDGFETRATQTATLTGGAGGFAVPEVIERAIARLGLDISPMRSVATVRTVGSPDYAELFDVGGAAFEWVGETDTRNQTNTPDLVELRPTFGMASAKPQATEESLDDMWFNVEQWLIDSASEAMAKGEGIAFLAGDGVKKPTGMLAGPAPVTTADSSRAFGTLQYYASAQAAAMPTDPNVFIDMVYGLRSSYRSNARWMANRFTVAALRKYKDTTNQYLWQPSVQAGQPATFMGYGIVDMEDMPIVAANAFPLAFGDFKEGYLICDRVGMRMTRDEITQPGFVKFYVRKRVGGKLRNTQAIKLLKIAAA